jgi:hypothetical protein
VSITVPAAPVPLKLVTVLLPASWAVIMMLKATFCVCVPMTPPPAASTLKWSSPPTLIVTLPEVPVLKVLEMAVNVPVPRLPVYLIKPVRLATPETKFPAWSSALTPADPRPDTVPTNGAFATMVT